MIDTLINCDCMEFMKTMGDKSVDLTLTDIPYDAVNKKETRDNKGIRKLNKGAADILTFDLGDFCEEVDRVTSNTIIIFCEIEQMPFIYSFFKNKGYPTRQLVWKKTNPSPMNGEYMYLSAAENAVWTKRGGGGTLVLNVYPMFLSFLQALPTFTRQKRTTTFSENLSLKTQSMSRQFSTLVQVREVPCLSQVRKEDTILAVKKIKSFIRKHKAA